MRLLFVADGRSPIALNWIQFFVHAGHEVHLASTFPANPQLNLSSLHMVPVAFSGMKSGNLTRQDSLSARAGMWSASRVGLRARLRQWFGPFTLGRAAHRLAQVIEQVQPDLVHAMRIPYEGMLAALSMRGERHAAKRLPLIISVWGNDFTLHARSTPWMGFYTRLAMQRANALHADCQRDVRLAKAWGFQPQRPVVVLPGAGGIQLDIFHPVFPPQGAGPERCLVVNPRGVRGYVRTDTFFRAIPQVLARFPEARFACPAMADEPVALGWLKTLKIAGSVDLLPRLSRVEMADLFRQAQVMVSPSTHDGTPNSLLEAMACGCLPVVGDLESIREWIIPGVNGLLVDAADAHALAQAILLALEQPDLRARAAQINYELIANKAEYGKVMRQAQEVYQRVIQGAGDAQVFQ